MQNLKILNKKESFAIFDEINEQWDSKIDLSSRFVLMQNSKDKYYIANRDVFDFPLEKLRISRIGLYFGELQRDGFRLSIEGAEIVGKSAQKNVIELSDEQVEEWIRGKDVELGKREELTQKYSGFLIIKNNSAFYGCGKYKISEDFARASIINFYPKIRRVNSPE